MYQDYKDLLSAFHAHGVKYLIVGGYAVIFHAQAVSLGVCLYAYNPRRLMANATRSRASM